MLVSDLHLGLLHFLHAFAAEVLQIAEAAIIFNVIHNRSEIWLLRRSNGLIHHMDLWTAALTVDPRSGGLVEKLEMFKGHPGAHLHPPAAASADYLFICLRPADHVMGRRLDEAVLIWLHHTVGCVYAARRLIPIHIAAVAPGHNRILCVNVPSRGTEILLYIAWNEDISLETVVSSVLTCALLLLLPVLLGPEGAPELDIARL